MKEELAFPTDEEDDGLARMAWRGPPAVVSARQTVCVCVCVCGSCCCVVNVCSLVLSPLSFLLYFSSLRVSPSPVYPTPFPLQDRYQFTAVTMLLEYLADSPVAPLQAALVEVPEPFCAEISESVYENSEACVGFSFSGVPTNQLPLLEDKYVMYPFH